MIRNKELFDRIFINDRAKFKETVEWFNKYKDGFMPMLNVPFDNGIICEPNGEYKGYNIGVFTVFDRIDEQNYQFEVYTDDTYQTACVNFKIQLVTGNIYDIEYPKNIPADRREKLKMVVKMDKTIEKCSLKWVVIMFATANQQDVIVADEKRAVGLSKHESKARRRSNKPVSLVRKTYVYNADVKLVRPDGKRDYTLPTHEVSVRGYWRTYSKTGKRVWVRPCVKYKGADTSTKDYQI